VLVEFSDHLTLIEAPLNEARTLAVIAKARELVPAKPLTQLVATHHHFDHTGGVPSRRG
jgi:glyoxylase-like metal-dependent hydrolase (beta-lactamase superfamily II)